MFRIALKNVLGRKGRLLLSSLAVIAGCTFLSGVFVFSDTIRTSIDDIFATAFEETDAYVRSAVEIETDFGDPVRGRISDALIEQIAAVPGVAEVEGDVQSFARMSTEDGDEIGYDGPPKYGSVFTGADSSPWELDEGRPANGPTEVVVDRLSAKEAKVGLGDTVNVTSAGGSRDFTVVGIVTFSGAESTGGPTWALFDLATAQEFVIGEADKVDSIIIRGDGSRTEEELKADLQQLFDADEIEVLTGTEIIEESQSELAKQFGFFTTFLTIFAGIALFVGSFIIYNVFKISAAQRMRENALMRAIGARSSQVTTALFVEAAFVGILGGILGFAGGVGLAALINVLLSAAGFGVGSTSLTIGATSFVVTLLVGVIVTLVCATFPAIRAGRVPPLAAMRDVSIDRSGHSKRRVVVSAVFAVIAVIGTVLGLTGGAIWLAPGMIGLMVTLVAVGPVVVRPVAGFLTRPLAKVRGVTGQIAGRNAARSPERTALTAAALGIGLALLVGVSILGSSVQDSFRKTIGETFTGDFAISSSDAQNGFGGLPLTLVDELNEVPEVEDAASFGAGNFSRIENGEPSSSLALVTNPAQAAKLIELDFASGGWADVSGTSIAVRTDKADDEGWTIGSTIDASFLDQSTETLTIGALFDDDFFGNYIADEQLFENRRLPFDAQIVAQSAPGVSEADVKAAIAVVTDKYPTAEVQTRGEYIDAQIAQLNGLLNFIYALLGMSVFIAILGIVLTLLLAVYERRRELGLMRAVGTTRAQVRSSVRWEAVVTALIGAIMGIALGVTLGWIVVRALKDEGINTFSLSPTTLVIFAFIAVLFAVIAAWIPARKAANAPILEAIATT